VPHDRGKKKHAGDALRQTTAFLDLLKAIAVAANEAPTLDQAMQICLDRVCAHTGWPVGHVYLHSGEPSGKLVPMALWHLDNPEQFEEFRKVTEATPLFPGLGLPGRVYGSKRPLWIVDVSKDPYFPTGKEAEAVGLRAGFAVPVLVGAEVAAVLEFFSTEAAEPDSALLDIMAHVGAQLGRVVERQRGADHRRELENVSRNLEHLYRLSTAVQEPLSLRQQLNRVLEAACQVVAVDRFYIWVVTPDDERLVSLATAGFSEEEVKPLLGVEIPLTEAGAMYKAYRERAPLLFDDQHPVPPDLYLKPPYSELKAIRTKSFMVIPMIARGRRVGLLTGDNKWSRRPIPPHTVELLQVFASHAAVAVENARLFQELQVRTRDLEIASKHKSQFLANMSHELRTPLNAILGYTELVLDEIYGKVPETIRDVLGRVQHGGRHLLSLINDVLDLSKIEAGQFTLSLTDYSLLDIVHTVFAAVEPLAAEKGLALRVAVSPDLPRGRGDERRIAQVLLNLVGNAIKFTETGEVKVDARLSDGQFVVEVSDTGPGISLADQQMIFEEFQRSDSSSTRHKGGTGLGLSIAKKIIELHGGRMSVESAVGKGSTFSFMLPVHVEEWVGT